MNETNVNSIQEECMTNVVSDAKLKVVQQNTLRQLKNYLSKTYGPMGSYTKIISGNNAETISADYSKDGLKVLKNIYFDQPIEFALQSELREVCDYVDHEVGDGTTSAVILSSLIYDRLLAIMNESGALPRLINKAFDNVVSKMKETIESKAHDLTIEDVYNICMVSTNGNERVSQEISDLYKEYGLDIDIELDISNDKYSKVKEYKGLTIGEGYASPAFINNSDKNTAEIHDAHIYYFKDPIDSPEMLNFLARIIEDNILIPEEEGDSKPVPTVIVAPMIGRDSIGILAKLDRHLFQYNAKNDVVHKPQILIVTTEAGVDEQIANDIQQICECKAIGKYIDYESQKTAQEKGDAPYIDKDGNTNIHEFAGHAEEVIADPEKTMFINPIGMMDGKDINKTIMAYLDAEIKKKEELNDDKVKIHMLKRRLRALKGNMVTYYVGGITVADRNAEKDLVEDAIKNCHSAAINGSGRAANYEGLEASTELDKQHVFESGTLEDKILKAIRESYCQAADILYGTVVPGDEADKLTQKSLEVGAPFNVVSIYNGETSTSPAVITSIRTDIEILNAISKIITPMVTSNQCLLQSTTLNKYY